MTFNSETVEETIDIVTSKREIYKVVEQMPSFPGCDHLGDSERSKCSNQKLMGFVSENLKYPKEAKDGEIEGQVVVRFVVNKNGRISNVELLRDIGAGTGQEVIRVVESMNKMEQKWTPGTQSGQPVNVYFHLPVKFKLD